MSSDTIDLFYQFTDFYENGEFLLALQSLLRHPDIAFDSLSSSSNEVPFHYLINYADACVNTGFSDSLFAREALISILEADEHLKILLEQFIETLKNEQVLQTHFVDAINPQINNIQDIPTFYKVLIEQKLQVSENCKRLVQLKPALGNLINGLKETHGITWHQFSYCLQVEPLIVSEGSVPIIFLESLYRFDYDSFLAAYKEQQTILVFETVATFFQLLQYDAVITALGEPQTVIYILEMHPDEQFNVQNFNWDESKTLKPVLMVNKSKLRDVMPILTEVLQKYLCRFCQSKGNAENNTSTANWLYNITQRLLFRIQAERYGKSRCIALNIKRGMKLWHDPYKGLPPSNAYLGALPTDFFGELIQIETKKRTARLLKPRSKIRIAHVAPQIVDGGHAPSKLIKTLLEYSDRSVFERFLIVTEQLINSPLEYPIAPYCSESSGVRGRDTLKFLNEKDVHILIEKPAEKYLKTAQNISSELSAFEFDIIIFHGPDENNCLSSSSANTPIRIMFDHGTLPEYPCFDFVIVSSEDAFNRNQEKLKLMGMECAPLHFSVDVRKQWLSKPYLKEEFGVPADSFVMTTISHHLDSRLSAKMCHAIGQILQKCPNTYYAPIGSITKEEPFRRIFDEYGVNNRVVFLGNRENPSQYLRSMELYLNEFPFGSGISIFDAMAAGCPVVTMYDNEGPQQARYGGIYFGIDRSITSLKTKDYVELACSLVSNKKLYDEWSKHALKQFEKHVDEKAYVKNFEKILKELLLQKRV